MRENSEMRNKLYPTAPPGFFTWLELSDLVTLWFGQRLMRRDFLVSKFFSPSLNEAASTGLLLRILA